MTFAFNSVIDTTPAGNATPAQPEPTDISGDSIRTDRAAASTEAGSATNSPTITASASGSAEAPTPVTAPPAVPEVPAPTPPTLPPGYTIGRQTGVVRDAAGNVDQILTQNVSVTDFPQNSPYWRDEPPRG